MLVQKLNAIMASSLSATQRMVLVVVAMRCGDGERFISVAELAAQSGLSESSVHRHVRTLTRAGALAKREVEGNASYFAITLTPPGLTVVPPGAMTTPPPLALAPPPPSTTTPGGCHHDTQEEEPYKFSLSKERDAREERGPLRDASSEEPSSARPLSDRDRELEEVTRQVIEMQLKEPTRRDRYAVKAALKEGTTARQLTDLLHYFREANDKDPVCARKGGWSEHFAPMLTPERLAASAQWAARRQPTQTAGRLPSTLELLRMDERQRNAVLAAYAEAM